MLGEFSPGNVSYIHHQVEFIEYWNFKSTKNFIWKSFQQFYLFLLFGSSRPSDASFIMTRSWHSPIAEIFSSITCQIFLNSSEYQIQSPVLISRNLICGVVHILYISQPKLPACATQFHQFIHCLKYLQMLQQSQ